MLVPHVVRCCVEEVERRGMDEVGIYRISGTTSEISTLKAAFNNSKKNITQKNDLFVGKCSDKELLQCKDQIGVSCSHQALHSGLL